MWQDVATPCRGLTRHGAEEALREIQESQPVTAEHLLDAGDRLKEIRTIFLGCGGSFMSPADWARHPCPWGRPR